MKWGSTLSSSVKLQQRCEKSSNFAYPVCEMKDMIFQGIYNRVTLLMHRAQVGWPCLLAGGAGSFCKVCFGLGDPQKEGEKMDFSMNYCFFIAKGCEVKSSLSNVVLALVLHLIFWYLLKQGCWNKWIHSLSNQLKTWKPAKSFCLFKFLFIKFMFCLPLLGKLELHLQKQG